MARFISIVSIAPKTGKTTIALNLGLALHKHNKRVLVFDGDFSKLNISEHLNLSYLPITLDQIFSGDNIIYEAIYRHASGLKIIPSLQMHDYERLSLYLHGLHVDYDYVIIDTPSDLSFLSSLLRMSDEALIVHDPAHSTKAVLDARQLIRMHKLTNLGLVLNKSHPDSVDSIYEVPVIAILPEHIHIKKSFDMKHPVNYLYPKSNISKSFDKIAQRLLV